MDMLEVCVRWHACVLGHGSVLSIDPVSISDAATYTCSAYNFAERNASMQVIVHCEYSVHCIVALALHITVSVVSVQTGLSSYIIRRSNPP